MSKRIVVTVLTEDASTCGLCTEHGLAIHIVYDDLHILLDFGQSDAFARNAEQLGINLSDVDVAVLSHAHYDHANGMPAFFERNSRAPLYLLAACTQSCWSSKGGTSELHYIGIKEGLLEQYQDRLRYVSTEKVLSIAPGVYLVSHTTPNLKERGGAAGMFLRDGGGWIPDGFDHEQSLVCKLDDSCLAVFSSCSHAGLAAITNEVQEAFPGWRMTAYVGGLHLVHASDEEILCVASAAKKAGIRHIFTAHCTGIRALNMLQSELPGCVDALYTGCVFEL